MSGGREIVQQINTALKRANAAGAARRPSRTCELLPKGRAEASITRWPGDIQ
jgi:hypothetical protein